MSALLELTQIHRKALVRRDLLKGQLEALESGLLAKKARLVAVEEAQAILQAAAKETQEQLRFQVTDIVQTAVDTIFPGKYRFCVDFEPKRGKTEASIYLEQDGLRMDPMDSNGGGVGDIIALGLRMACWTIGRTDNVLIMDEPYKNLSAGFRPDRKSVV